MEIHSKIVHTRVAMGRILVTIGILLVALGLIFIVGEKFGLGRLPGDINIKRENFQFSFPIVTSLVLSVVLSLGLWIFNKFFK